MASEPVRSATRRWLVAPAALGRCRCRGLPRSARLSWFVHGRKALGAVDPTEPRTRRSAAPSGSHPSHPHRDARHAPGPGMTHESRRPMPADRHRGSCSSRSDQRVTRCPSVEVSHQRPDVDVVASHRRGVASHQVGGAATRRCGGSRSGFDEPSTRRPTGPRAVAPRSTGYEPDSARRQPPPAVRGRAWR